MKIKYILEIVDEDKESAYNPIFSDEYTSEESMLEDLGKVDIAIKEYAKNVAEEMEENQESDEKAEEMGDIVKPQELETD